MKHGTRLLHGSLTVLTKVRDGAEVLLREELKKVEEVSASFFAGWPDVYFARWALLDHKPPTYLLFAVDFARPASRGERLGKDELVKEFINRFLEVLIEREDRTFDAIYAHCEGYPQRGIEKGERDKVSGFLVRNQHPYTGRHIDFAYRVASPDDLSLAARVRTTVDEYRRENGANLSTRLEVKPEEARQAGAQFHAACRTQLSSSRELEPDDAEQRRQKSWAAEVAAARATVAYGLGIGLLSVVGGAVLVVSVLLNFRNLGRMVAAGGVLGLSTWVRSWLRAPTPVHSVPRSVRLEEPVQNPMVHVVEIKPGREWLVSLTLRVVNLRAKRYRAGLNVLRTIHFARWVITHTDQGCQLLFLSNYDGSWDAYIGDFVDLLSLFLNAAWFNTRGYPKTWLIIKGGAEDIEAFRCWIREHEVETNVWYQGGNTTLSINNIHNDLQLCRILSEKTLSAEDEARLGILLRTGLCLTQQRMRTPISAGAVLWKHYKGLHHQETRT